MVMTRGGSGPEPRELQGPESLRGRASIFQLVRGFLPSTDCETVLS